MPKTIRRVKTAKTGNCRAFEMSTRSSYGRRRIRSERGASISEVGPALFILLFCGLFVVVDVIGVGFNYLCCMTLNDLQLREAAKLPSQMAQEEDGPIISDIPVQFRQTVMGGLSGLRENPVTKVEYGSNKGNTYVTVSTTATASPFLTIPIFPGVPGLGAPVVFTVSGTRLII
ncbi:MAG: hypothetical protein K8F91_00910 [Candidatus Obscuribacterales bacterium]|nr:hypothetical protein [Candidatus Obscuribacterales bacterium]